MKKILFVFFLSFAFCTKNSLLENEKSYSYSPSLFLSSKFYFLSWYIIQSLFR